VIILYSTIWVALALLVTAEAGKSLRPGATWIRTATIVGAQLGIIHALLALAQRYNWNHALAVTATAQQAAAVYGYEWPGSIYINYIFLAVWLTVGWRLRHWVWRVFVLTMVVNGAVVFVRPSARPLGVVLVAVLLFVWARPLIQSSGHAVGKIDP